MATMNSFHLLGDDDNEDPIHLIQKVQLQAVAQPKKPAAANQAQAQPNKQAKLPSKPVPPAQAVREARHEDGRGGGRGGGRGFGRGRGGTGGINRDTSNHETTYGGDNGYHGGSKPSEGGETGKLSERRSYGGGPRGGFHGGRRSGYINEEAGEERPRRPYDRRSGTGHGNEFKRDGAGRGNWGTPTDEIAPDTDELVAETEKNVNTEKQPGDKEAADANKESSANEAEEKKPEDKEMTLEEYEKVLEEKRKALLAMKPAEGRKVDEKEFESMQQLSSKKSNDEIFIKWGSEKDKRKDASEKEERAKKSVSINEFLKPAEGESYYSGGRGRGRGRGARGGYGGNTRDIAAPSIEDPGQFPTLGGK